MDAATEKRLLSIEETARMLNVSERGIRRLVHSDELPFHRVGDQLRFDPDEVLDATRGKPSRRT
jgi:excisionase family DNA binding protein